ncbi:MAG: hypothetical protein ABFS38_23015, partial [Bacteroidota bacterium]
MKTTNSLIRGSLKYGMLSASLLTIQFNSQPAMAQRYTYVGVGMSLYAANISLGADPFLTKASYVIDGGAYDVTVRQEINHFLSIETGISAHNFEHDYIFNDEVHVHSGAFPVHKIPLKAELEVDLFRDRIAAYGSFGYQFCIRMNYNSGRGAYYSYAAIGGSVDVEWDYISDGPFYSLYQVGAGTRFRLVDALLFEMEIGYGFSLKDMVTTTITYKDRTGEENVLIHKEGLNYWYLQGGFSYPVQRVVQIMRDLLKSFNSKS